MQQSYWQIDVLEQANYNPSFKVYSNIFFICPVARQRFIPVTPFGDARQLSNR